MSGGTRGAGHVQLKRQEQDWNELAELDPYWAILIEPGKRFGHWNREEFFATGPPEADALLNRAAQLEHPQARLRALDFGCGLGRMTRALADHFEECVGVDISENMVRGARELNGDLAGVSFVVNRAGDLSIFDDGSFDFIYSTIVLQHVPDRHAIKAYVAEFCRVLRPGGLAVFHSPATFRRPFACSGDGGCTWLTKHRLRCSVSLSTSAPAPNRDELHPRARNQAAPPVGSCSPAGRRDV